MREKILKFRKLALLCVFNNFCRVLFSFVMKKDTFVNLYTTLMGLINDLDGNTYHLACIDIKLQDAKLLPLTKFAYCSGEWVPQLEHGFIPTVGGLILHNSRAAAAIPWESIAEIRSSHIRRSAEDS